MGRKGKKRESKRNNVTNKERKEKKKVMGNVLRTLDVQLQALGLVVQVAFSYF